MPLEHSPSQSALKHNIGTLMGEVGKSPHIQTRAQALRIAYETQRRARGMGGVVPGYDFGGGVDPQQQQMAPPPGVMPQMMPGNVPGAPVGVAGPQMGPPPPPGMNTAPAPGAPPPPQGQWASGVAQNAAPPAIPQNAPPMPPNAAPAEQPMGKQLMANGGALQRAGGGFSMSKAPHLDSGWQTRSAAKSMLTGPILSAVPGRTDKHSTHVPSGSYVIPADIISGRGQGNTIAGANVIQSMFRMGPYGSPSLKIKHGIGAPRPPRAGVMRADGGQADSSIGTPVPVMLAGGELVVPPENLMEVVHPDLNYAHRVMDAWVLHERKNLRKTLANLPGPAKD